ncbi:M15 family metallopeptidase [Fluoribacter gormanii]|uniref:D-alanyl-D-alanine dipeptidase n=1 Tax=Fluoribacter gormanii TaxID=464 RepID=A0A377GFE2_9GAMM|nr:M15 family metallopeptidase [Fluoribacter gormanii]KTD01671.1 D-alanyl-D-alanine dipeptidase [Fluoribacter gormanii]SIR64777.1 D-alanyl-D-alanine dipeptidase [Fluoribacter gormanii]STO23478.1 D-alanyl-D-alanine dipeptidase [Fluoribacter gormanii]
MSDNTIQDSILLIADPKIVAIPVIENHDPIIDLVNHPEIIYGPSPEIPNNTDYTKMRKTVYEKLNQAQSLLPKGLRFCLYESYRSLALQKFLFDTRYGKVKNKHPEWSSEQIFTETTRLVSPVINLDGSPNIPPHSTGAAIDVYLINDQGEAIEMGIHPKDWMEDLDGSLSLTASEIITDEAKQNRKIMCHVLETVGFVNYRNEYWHWSYGDRYWAYYKQQPYACYDNYK